jgi:alpha-galactosidase
MPGTKGYEFEDMIQFAKWRCDYVKIDWCNTQGQDIIKTYTKLHDAQHAAGRPIVHSLCSWGVGEPWKWAASVGHLWRTTGDICGPGHADWKKAMKIVSKNERLYKSAGPGHWNDPDMMVVGMDGLSESQNRSFFSLWCIMASPLIAGNDLRNMSASTIEILTNMEAIGINQDPLGIQGHIVRRDGDVSIWAGKPLYDRSQAVLALNQQSSPRDVRIEWSDIGIDKEAGLYVRDLWTHKTSGPHTNDVSVPVAANDVVMLRISKANDFSLPPIIVADSYLVSLRAADTVAQSLSATITISNKGSDDLPLWKVQKGLPSWLTVTVSKDGKNQTLTNTISTSGLKKGLYHAIVRADNTEPVSGKPMSAVYYDVDLEVPNDVATQSKTAIKLE